MGFFLQIKIKEIPLHRKIENDMYSIGCDGPFVYRLGREIFIL